MMRIDTLDVSADGTDGDADNAAMDKLRTAVLVDPTQAEAAYKLLKGYCRGLLTKRTGADRRGFQRELRRNEIGLRPASVTPPSRTRVALGAIGVASLVAVAAVTLNLGQGFTTQITSVNKNLEALGKQDADPDVLVGKMQSHIRRRAVEEIAAAQARSPDDWRKRDEIEKRRDQTLEAVQDLVATIREGLAGDPDPIFIEAANILDKPIEGVDAAIKYLEQKQPTIERKIGAAKSFRDRADQRLREAYRPTVLQADLYESSLRWDEALRIRDLIVRENPSWFDSRIDLGVLLLELARYSDAEPHLREALKLAAQPGEEAMGSNNLAELLRNTNRIAEAEPLFRRALAINERSYGPDHANVATNLNNLAELLRNTNRIAEAEPLFRRALAINERSRGPDQAEFAADLNNLALLLEATGRTAHAEPLFRRALAIAEPSTGPGHPLVANCLNNLAAMFQATNRVVEAEPLYRRALAIDEQSYGSDHPLVANRLNNLAAMLQATNRMAEAEPLCRRALAIDEHSYGPDHPFVANCLNNLATLLHDTNRIADAEPLYRRALAIDERSYGPRHPNVAIDLSNLAGLLHDTNRTVVAEPLMRRALAIDQSSYGPDSADVAKSLNNMAELLRATNRMSEAEPLYRRAMDIDERTYGPDHPAVARDLNNQALLLFSTNRIEAAEPLMARAVRILSRFQRSTGHEHPNLRQNLDNYRQLLAALKLAEPEISRRIKSTTEVTDKLAPIVPEVERLIGPTRSVADVLSFLDRHYKEMGKPAVYLLGPDEPIAQHLDNLLRPNGDELTARGLAAFNEGAHADSVVLCEAALDPMADQSVKPFAMLRTRILRAAALRELGLAEKACNEISALMPELERAEPEDASWNGRVRYHLALCLWRLGAQAAAQKSAEDSLAAYDSALKVGAIDPALRPQSAELLAALKDGRIPPPQPAIDAPAAIEAARARHQAREALN